MTLAVIHTRQSTILDSSFAGLVVAGGESVHTQVLVRPRLDDDSRQAVALDAFEAVYRQAMLAPEPFTLHVNDADVRTKLLTISDSFPAVNLVTTARGRMPALLHAAGAAMSARLDELFPTEPAPDETPAKPRMRPEATIATDASKGSNRRGVGVACVRADGVHRQKALPDVKSVLHGELLAIELAVASFTGQPLHILSDSRAALACLREDHENRAEVAATVARIRHRAHGRPVRYSWVRGHNGHPLNETAHRLAVAARRGHEAAVAPEIQNAVADNIVAPLLAGVA